MRLVVPTEPAEGRLSRPYDEVMGTGGLQELSAKVRKSYGLGPELTGAKVCTNFQLSCSDSFAFTLASCSTEMHGSAPR
jgi:hypothetical protein